MLFALRRRHVLRAIWILAIHHFEDLIAYISQSETLHPGEFLGSGTCSGAQCRGCGLEMGKFLEAGDVVELEVEKVGILRNTVVG